MKKTAILLLILLTFISCKDEINVITSKQPGKIVGTVFPRESVATIQLIQGEIISTTVTDNGIFQFRDVAPGIYRLSIKANNFGKQEIGDIKVEDGEGNDIGIVQLSTIPYPLKSITLSNGSGRVSTTTGSLRFQFSEYIDPSTLEQAFTIEPKINIDRIYNSGNKTISFYTTFNFGTEYVVTIDTSLTTKYGENLEFPYTFTFTTTNFILEDIRYPYITRYSNDPLELIFNGELVKYFNNIIVVEPNIPVEVFSNGNSRIVVSPTFGWMADTTFNITVSKSLEEINGATLENDTTISFSTPQLKIIEAYPANNQYYIDTSSSISIKTNYILDEGSIKNAISFSPEVDFQINTSSRSGRTDFRLYPSQLSANTKYTITIDQSLTDFYGVPLREDYIFSFTTKE